MFNFTQADYQAARILLELSVGNFQNIREAYRMNIEAAMTGYLLGGQSLAASRNLFKRSAATAFVDAFETGYQDGGGELPYEQADGEWLSSRTDAELGYIGVLFQDLAGIKKDGDEAEMYETIAAKTESYLATLNTVYNEGRVRGMGNLMLTLGGDDGFKSCGTCQRLKGQRHRAKWWVSRGLVPGPGNRNYECCGYNCYHYLFDDMGNLVTF